MTYFDPGPVPSDKITPQYMKKLLISMMDSINKLSIQNFPNTVSGTIITPGTLSVQMSDLEWGEIPIPLVLPATAVTTTSTAGLNLGGYFLWNALTFPGGDWYLEASMSIGSGGTATLTLTGAADIGNVTTTETGLTLVRSEKLTMPTTGQNIWVVLKTSNASYTASLAGARLIFVPS
jgi:hypothetical protein